MKFGARFGSFALVAVVLLCASPGFSQTETPSGPSDKAVQTDTPGTWTEPPVRGAAGPRATDPGKPADKAAAPETAGRPVENAAGPEQAAPNAAARQQAKAQTRPARQSATSRREQIRVAARSRTLADAPAHRSRYGRVAHVQEEDRPRVRTHRRFGERRSYAYRAYRSEPARYAVRFAAPYGQAEDAENGGSPYGWRRAGWGGLLGDDRESRIARAREAGYLVVRSRTYTYPDGMRVREMTPYGLE